jgi:hypothetical protein
MKKLFIAAIPLFTALVACDPSVDEVEKGANITAEELTNSFEIVAKSTGNNNLSVNMNPVRYVKVHSTEDDVIVGEGTKISFQVVPPAREVSYYLEAINPDGTTVKSGSKSINVSEFTDLPAIYMLVFGENGSYGTTTWTWNTEAPDGVWGNGGYLGNTGPGWWVVSAADIDSQATGKDLPNDGLDGWFSLNLSTVKTSRGETGTVKVTEDIVQSGWDVGSMTFTNTIPLMGIQVNEGNTRQYFYHILKITDDELRLCAPETGAGAWGTAWFWNFKKIANK